MQTGHRQNTGSLQGKNNHIWDGISGSCPTGEISQEEEDEKVTRDTYSYWKGEVFRRFVSILGSAEDGFWQVHRVCGGLGSKVKIYSDVESE
jgi:hypothetical protein